LVLIDREDVVFHELVPFMVRAPAHYFEHITELLVTLEYARDGWKNAQRFDGDPRWMHLVHGFGSLVKYLEDTRDLIFDEMKMVLGELFSKPLHHDDEHRTDHFRLPTLEEFTIKNRLHLHAVSPTELTKDQVDLFREKSIPEPWLGGLWIPLAVPGCTHWVTKRYTKFFPKIAAFDMKDAQYVGLGGSQWKRETRLLKTWPPTCNTFPFNENWAASRWAGS
jgi:hypothetical protein